MNTVYDYFDSLSENEKEISYSLHDFILDFPNNTCKLSYKVPFYYKNSWISYLAIDKFGRLELAFPRASEIPSIYEFVDFRERKQVAGIILKDIKSIDFELLKFIFNEVLLLDSSKKYKIKRSKNH